MSASEEKVKSGGTYVITNAKSQTVIDLSGTDQYHSIVGFPYFNGPNQKWTLTWANTGWTFKNVGTGLYLGVENSSPNNGTRLIGVKDPVLWHIYHDEQNPNNYRIFVPEAPKPGLNIDLSGYGSSIPATPIILWTMWDGIHQTWGFSKV